MEPKRRYSSRKPGKSGMVAAAISAGIVLLFTVASIVFFLAGMKTPDANYCGPLGHYLAKGLDIAFGKASILVPLFLGLAAVVGFSRGRYGRRLGGICLIILSLWLVAALATYQSHSPAAANLAGAVGVFAAGLLSALLGIVAYLVPALALVWGFNQWFRRDSYPDLLHTLFLLLAGIITTMFLDLLLGRFVLVGPPPLNVQYPLGGMVGVSLVVALKSIIGPVGTLIALIGVTLLIIVAFAAIDLPEFGWLRRLGLAAWKAVRRLPVVPRPTEPQVAPAPEPVAPTEPAPSAVEPAMPVPSPTAESQPDLPAVTIRTRPQPRRTAVPKFDLSEFQARFLELLDQPTDSDRVFKDRGESETEANVLLDKLRQFDIEGRISDILSGPMITRFEFEPAPGVKIGSIASRADDISLALAAERIRILAPIPGKNAVGIEIPNKERRNVYLREVLTSAPFREERSPLGFALGTTITGEPTSADLRTMPHILIAGTTGSGKSVCINSLIASIIYRSSPRDVRFLTIDPKQLELPIYNPIPHLLGNTTIDPDRAVRELGRIVNIMEHRYGEFANIGVRDIVGYNQRAEQDGFDRKPYIVVIIDELADLMLRAPTEIEMRITRLAQMSRAVGIHLVLATQRPSVDVITGLIKANFPCRIAFQVASKTDSRTILDMNGAESLLGRGDMLFLPPGKGEPARLHGSFISDRAARRVVDLWATTYLAELLDGLVEDPEERAARLVENDVVDVFYDPEKSGIKRKQELVRTILPEDVVDALLSRRYYAVLSEESPDRLAERERRDAAGDREIDEKFAEAAQIVVRHREASVSMLQRRLDIGWARAGRIIDQLEQTGIVGPYVGSKSRKVLIDNEGDLQKLLAEKQLSDG